jgi:hypothetical protein
MTKCLSKYACIATLLALAATACKRSPANLAPEEPARPSGPTKAAIDFPSLYSTFTVDPEDDSVAYRFDWGDGRVSSWSRYLPPGYCRWLRSQGPGDRSVWCDFRLVRTCVGIGQ